MKALNQQTYKNRKKLLRTLKVLSTITLVVVAGLYYMSWKSDSSVASRTASSYVVKAYSGKRAEAYALTSSRFQKNVSKEAFVSTTIKAEKPKVTISAIAIKGSNAGVVGRLVDERGLAVTFTQTLIKESGSWKLQSFYSTAD